MTDYTKLIDDYATAKAEHDFMADQGTSTEMRDDFPALQVRVKHTRAALQSAIEALQGENGQLHASLQSARVSFEQVCKHRDALQAKLDELQRQEPVAHTTTEELEFLKDKRPSSAMLFNFTEPDQKFVALYAAPKALEPLTVEEIERIHQRYGGDMVNCTRAIERHHGITKGTPT